MAYLNMRYDDLAVLWLDAHPDLNTPERSPSGALHGMVLRLLLGEGDAGLLDAVKKPLEPEQVFLLGVRDFDLPERAYIEEKRLQHFSVLELEEHSERLVEALKAGGFKNLHIRFDLDVLDPEMLSATGYPTADGLSVAGAMRLSAALEASFNVVGLTLSEYLPPEYLQQRDDGVVEMIVNRPCWKRLSRGFRSCKFSGDAHPSRPRDLPRRNAPR